MHIDLNADMGEGYGAYRIGRDEELLHIVTSANVACGFHGGDATIMQKLAALAKRHGVSLGANPGFDDLWGFDGRPVHMNARDLEYMVAYQIGAVLQALAAYSGEPLRHVKPHGALYNMAAKDEGLRPRHSPRRENHRREAHLCGHARLRNAKGCGSGRFGFCARGVLLSPLPRRRVTDAALRKGL